MKGIHNLRAINTNIEGGDSDSKVASIYFLVFLFPARIYETCKDIGKYGPYTGGGNSQFKNAPEAGPDIGLSRL